MLNSSGAIVARYSYDPYGRTTLVSGTNLATFQYTGDYYHATSGLNLTWFRVFDPNTGRWLSRDPLGEGIGPNLYNYVNNDPARFVDPLGLQSDNPISNAQAIEVAAQLANDAGDASALADQIVADSNVAEQTPVNEIARMMNLHAGKPLEGARRDIVIVADTQERRIGIEAAQDRILNGAHGVGVNPTIQQTAGRKSPPRGDFCRFLW